MGRGHILVFASSVLRIYLHMAFLMRGRGFEQRAKQRTFEYCITYAIDADPRPHTVMIILKEI